MAGDPVRPACADRRAHRLGQDPGRVSCGDRRTRASRRRAALAGRNLGRLRLTAQGAIERRAHQSASAARRDSRRAAKVRLSQCGNPYLCTHRRYAAVRTHANAQTPAAYRGDDARVAVHPARLRIRSRNAGEYAQRDRRRNPRTRTEQARRTSGAVAGAAGSLVRAAFDADRLVGDAEADRRNCKVSRWREHAQRTIEMRNRRRRLHAPARSRH